MTPSIMSLDVFKLCRLAKCGYIPIQSTQPLVQCRIAAADIADIALEVLNIHGIEADDRRVESNIGFRDVGAVVEGGGVGGEVGFDAVEGFEEGLDGVFVSFLRPGRG